MVDEEIRTKKNDNDRDDQIEDRFRKQLEKQLFWWVKINGRFEGVLVFVGKDFIILVGDDCKIFEIPLEEIDSLQKRAPGCPDRRHDKHHDDYDD
ncbi:MAG TPA: hypothetical protein GX691_05050 [Clostridia bacterium]|jgi:hypothetical protein|nr:hypothetical protein [Clostridia bacterium]